MLVLLVGLAGCGLSDTEFLQKSQDARCAKWTECLDGFDENDCSQIAVEDTTGCDYDPKKGQECLDALPDAQCGAEEDFFVPVEPAACEQVFTNCN